MMVNNVFGDIIHSDIFREEFFVAEVQARLSEMMESKGVSRAELARRLDVSRARVTQIFSDEYKNFTVRLLVRSFLALGEEPMLVCRSEFASLQEGRASATTAPPTSEPPTADGIAEAVIASLLRASIGERPMDSERAKRVSDARDWASAGSNVIPLRERAYG